jgi:hypothetical protein
VPLLETLLADLKEHARRNGVPSAQTTRPLAAAAHPDPKPAASWRERAFQTN